MAPKNLHFWNSSAFLHGFVLVNEADPTVGQAEAVEKVEKDPMTREALLKLKEDITVNLLKKDKQDVWQSFLKSLEDSRILNAGTDVLTGLVKIEGNGYTRKAEFKRGDRRVYLQGFSNVIFLQAVLTKLMTDDPQLGIKTPGDLDGRWGSQTEESLRSLQKALKIKPDGQFGPKTFDALRAYFAQPTEKEKEASQEIVLDDSLKSKVDEGIRKLRVQAPNAQWFLPAQVERDNYLKDEHRIQFPLRDSQNRLVYLEVEGEKAVLESQKALILAYLAQTWSKEQ